MFGFGRTTTPTLSKAEQMGQNTQTYRVARAAKVDAFIPHMYNKVFEKIQNHSSTHPDPNVTIKIVDIVEKTGDNMFAVFVGKDLNVLHFSDEEYKSIANGVTDRLRADKFIVEFLSHFGEATRAIELNVCWSLPIPPPPPAPAVPVPATPAPVVTPVSVPVPAAAVPTETDPLSKST